ncbi:MAG: polyketide antibiotic transporter [Nocardioides sp.]|nr:polyketide antibiotic transporter [Nocardioides sp.]
MTGWTLLLRTFLRRDRWHFLWWSVGLAILYVSQGWSVDGLYTTQQDFDEAAALMESNTAFIAMTGPPRALNTTGGQVIWQSAAFGAVTIGLMSMLLVARHTRHEEETGREELVRATAVGRHAPLVAATVTVLLANLVVGAVVGGGLAAYGLPVADSVASGVGLSLCGAFFTGVAVLAAQLTSTTRGLYGITGAVIGTAYFLRAIGDVGSPALSWLSPIGWYQAMHPYSGLRWWPAVLLVAAAALTTAVGYLLFLRRDLGSGLMAARPGPGRAGVGLRSGFGLAWRLQRGSVIGWSVGMLLGGLAYGSIGDEAGDLLGDSDLTRDMFAAGAEDLVDGFFAVSLVLMALIATAYTLSSVSRPRSQEEAGYAEMMLATGVTRMRWLVGQLAVCLLGTLVVVGSAGLGIALGYAMATGDGGGFERFALPMLAQVAPVLVVLGFVVFMYGVFPRLQVAGWGLLGFALVVLMFGEVLRFPEWVRWLSPFEHLALAPAETFRVAPFLTLLAVAVALTALGAFAFRRRDIA